MNYSPKYFKDNMPEWKRKKDPILSRLFYRPCAFVLASICANLKIQANTVSYFSGIIAVVACLCFLPNSLTWHIVAAVLINFWLVLDCTDGNLARSYKKQPFGEFADGISSYILVGLMCTTMAVAVYFEGGYIISKGCPWIIFIGALASSADTMMRLIYQKYKSTERELADAGILEIEQEKRKDHEQVNSLRVRFESDFGIGGILPLLILIATIFQALDLIVLYCFIYYGGSFVLATALYVRKAMANTKKYQETFERL